VTSRDLSRTLNLRGRSLSTWTALRRTRTNPVIGSVQTLPTRRGKQGLVSSIDPLDTARRHDDGRPDESRVPTPQYRLATTMSTAAASSHDDGRAQNTRSRVRPRSLAVSLHGGRRFDPT